jgi:predicted nucleic acid-binding Zn ribbon protein
MTSEERGLQPIGSSLDAFLRRLGMPSAVDLTTIVETWSETAGEPFAAMSRPIGLHDGELVVGVDTGSSATLLKYRIGELLDRLQTRFGSEMIQSIRIRVESRKNTL